MSWRQFHLWRWTEGLPRPVLGRREWIEEIVEECKKYAQVTMSDYVCLENFGGFMSQDIGNNMIIIRPRIFTKIVDN